MRAWAMAVVAASFAVGCAASRPAVAPRPGDGVGGSGAAGQSRRYVDPQLGFELSRPDGAWQLQAQDEPPDEGVVVPIILRHPASGAQVVLQVAPALASPSRFAERLNEGLRRQPGTVTSEPELVGPVDGAVGFRFTMGEKLLGRVVILEGAEGRMLMLLATWPSASPPAVTAGLDQIFGSVRAVPPPHG